MRLPVPSRTDRPFGCPPDQRRTRRRRRPEDELQRALVQHLRTRPADGLVWFHVPNQGFRRRIEAAILKGLGVQAGVSDLIFLHRGRFLALELKAKGGKPTPEQVDFLARVTLGGGVARCVDDLDEAITWLEMLGVLKGLAA